MIKKYFRMTVAGLILAGFLSCSAFADESQFDKFGGWKGLKGTKTRSVSC